MRGAGVIGKERERRRHPHPVVPETLRVATAPGEERLVNAQHVEGYVAEPVN
jgi:hypothetical protein